MDGGSFVAADLLTSIEGPKLGRIPTALSALGMGSPLGRFIGFSLVTGGLIYVAKPSIFFVDGSAKPWSLLTLGKPSGGVKSTAVPWYLVALLVGFVGATFL
jgi:hypothetical protein